MRKTIGIVAAMFVVCVAARAQAADSEGADYPAPDCVKPDVKLISPQTQYSSGTYSPDNSRIATYNKQGKAFDACMHAYIDNANSAIVHIRDKANSDVKRITDDANGRMKAAQTRVRDAISEANAVSAEEADAVAKAAKSR